LLQIAVEPFKFSQSYCLAAANAVVNLFGSDSQPLAA
jgi:hypothetical protein